MFPLVSLLIAEPYGYSTAQIGLVSLVGIAGVVAAQRVGILEDRGHGTAAMGVFGLVAAVGMAITCFGTTSIWSVLVGALILNVGIQGAGVLTQTRLLSLSTDARSRLNTALVTSNCPFGATCSALAAWLWLKGGWPAVVGCGLAVLGLGLLTWVAAKARLNAVTPGRRPGDPGPQEQPSTPCQKCHGREVPPLAPTGTPT